MSASRVMIDSPLQRYLLRADWHFGERVRFFTQLQSGIEIKLIY
jgi:hypothetical protein